MKSGRGRFLIALGLLLIAAAVSLAAYNLYDGRRAELEAKKALCRLKELMPEPGKTPETLAGGLSETVAGDLPETLPPESDWPEEIELPDYVLNPEMEMPVREIDGIGYVGTVRIPALELELPVISEWSYPHLRVAPCRYEGSAYLDHLVIAGHNYESHFGALWTLCPGDTVVFTDMDGNEFRYEIVVMETLLPADVEEMTSDEYDLTLFTCTVSWAERVTVRCERTEGKLP